MFDRDEVLRRRQTAPILRGVGEIAVAQVCDSHLEALEVIQVLKETLKKVEWAEAHIVLDEKSLKSLRFCPACGGEKSGHADKCALKRALKRAEPTGQPESREPARSIAHHPV